MKSLIKLVLRVQSLKVPGRDYLSFDSRFTLFRKQNLAVFTTPFGPARSLFNLFEMTRIDGVEVVSIHAPSELVVPVPPGAQEVELKNGYVPAAYLQDDNDVKTDGAYFSAYWVNDAQIKWCWSTALQPATKKTDRGLHGVIL